MIINYVMQYLYDKFKAYKKFLGLITLGLLLSSQSFADKKFDKDLKKLSKFLDFNIFNFTAIKDEKIPNIKI